MKSVYRLTLTSLLRMAALLAVFWSIVPARAAQTWNEVTAPPVWTTNCITQQSEQLSVSSIAWFGDPNSPPPVNTVYYVRIRWKVTGDPCTGGAQVAPELHLPEGTTLAISGANKVTCYAVNQTTGATSPETPQCPQAASTGVLGGFGFYPTCANPPCAPGAVSPAWPTAQGFGWEIHVPLLSTMPLSGIVTSPDPTVACSSCLTAAVWSIDGLNSPWAYPRVGVIIGGPAGMPSITYPSPSTSNVTSTSAIGTAVLARQNTTGNVFFEFSATAPSGSTCHATSNSPAVTPNTPSSAPFNITLVRSSRRGRPNIGGCVTPPPVARRILAPRNRSAPRVRRRR